MTIVSQNEYLRKKAEADHANHIARQKAAGTHVAANERIERTIASAEQEFRQPQQAPIKAALADTSKRLRSLLTELLVELHKYDPERDGQLLGNVYRALHAADQALRSMPTQRQERIMRDRMK